MLAQPIPDMALPELKLDDDISLCERAAEVGYGDGELAPRGEGNLRALYCILGVLPSTYEERLAFCG
jgi:hypothetical protein